MYFGQIPLFVRVESIDDDPELPAIRLATKKVELPFFGQLEIITSEDTTFVRLGELIPTAAAVSILRRLREGEGIWVSVWGDLEFDGYAPYFNEGQPVTIVNGQTGEFEVASVGRVVAASRVAFPDIDDADGKYVGKYVPWTVVVRADVVRFEEVEYQVLTGVSRRAMPHVCTFRPSTLPDIDVDGGSGSEEGGEELDAS